MANGKRVPWFKETLKPPASCGTYTFTSNNGGLKISDGCTADSIQGWPAIDPTPNSSEMTKPILRPSGGLGLLSGASGR